MAAAFLLLRAKHRIDGSFQKGTKLKEICLQFVGTFYYLRFGLAVILSYVGVKMIVTDINHNPPALSLLIITVILAITIVVSIIRTRRISQPIEEVEEKKEAVPVSMVSPQDEHQQQESL